MDLARWPVRITRPVYFSDFNLAGHVDNVRYVAWMNIVRTALHDEAGLMPPLGVGAPMLTDPIPVLAEFRIRYRFPRERLDPVVLLSRVASVGDTGFVQEHAVYDPERDDLAAVGESQLVMVDPATGTRTTLADEPRRALSRMRGIDR